MPCSATSKGLNAVLVVIVGIPSLPQLSRLKCFCNLLAFVAGLSLRVGSQAKPPASYSATPWQQFYDFLFHFSQF